MSMLPYDQDWGAVPVGFPAELLDPSGRLKIGRGQNVYDVDFEYGLQTLRWENFTSGSAAIGHRPIEGGVRMDVTASGDVAIRQSKPYFRYQPSKGLYASAAVLFGAPAAGITRRVGMFDSDNGVFFEQDSAGLWAVRRTNTGNGVVDTRVAQRDWTLDGLGGTGRSGRVIDPTRIQMAVIDYAWYGAGRARLGFILSGKLVWCHAFDSANVAGQILPWCRTGNLPCRYEIRRASGTGLQSFWHWGVSVVVEGGFDEQRGFTFPHANPARVAVTTRRPILASRIRPLGVIETSGTATAGAGGSVTASGWTVNQWRGRYVLLTGGTGAGQMARVTTNTTTVLTVLAGCGAILAGDRTGRLRLSDPLARDPVPQFDIPAAWILECRPVALPAAFQPPPRVVEVAWGRNWSPLSNMAGSVPAADRQRLEAAQSVARAESTLVTSRVAQQRSLALPGLYATEVAAAARAARWRDWIERGPRLVAVTTDRYLGQIEIGQIGRIAYPAYGLDAGLSGVVVGWREALAGRRVEIILAGSD